MSRAAGVAAVLLCMCAAQFVAAEFEHGWAPDHLRSLLSTPSSLAEEEDSGTARKLQQTTFAAPEAPFTFDGFDFGFGGLLPSNQGFFPFTNNVWQILFRDLFNPGLGQSISNNLPNQVDVYRLLPRYFQDLFGSDPVTLFGYDALDRYIGQYLTLPRVRVGDRIPAGCIGPIYSLVVNGGTCTIRDDGTVRCNPPTITFKSTPLVCNLPYKAACSLTGQSFRYRVSFGRTRSSEIGPPAGVYNFGTAFNITRAWLGFNLASRRVINDFGIKNWYNFLADWAQLEMTRIGRAITTFAVHPVPLAVRNAADGNSSVDITNTTGGAELRAGLQNLTDSGMKFATKLASRLGISGVDPRQLLERLSSGTLGRLLNPRSSGTAGAAGDAAAANSAANKLMATITNQGLPQSGLQTQQYVSDALAGDRTSAGVGNSNPYALQTKFNPSDKLGTATQARASAAPAPAEGVGNMGTLGVGDDGMGPSPSPAIDGVLPGPTDPVQQTLQGVNSMLGGQMDQAAPGSADMLAGTAPSAVTNNTVEEQGNQALLAEQVGSP